VGRLVSALFALFSLTTLMREVSPSLPHFTVHNAELLSKAFGAFWQISRCRSHVDIDARLSWAKGANAEQVVISYSVITENLFN
jgi:hypothetical protein